MNEPLNPDTSTLGPDFLNKHAMPKAMGFSLRKLNRLHAKRLGPPRICLGQKVYYHRPSVLAWLVRQQQDGTPLAVGRGARRRA